MNYSDMEAVYGVRMYACLYVSFFYNWEGCDYIDAQECQ